VDRRYRRHVVRPSALITAPVGLSVCLSVLNSDNKSVSEARGPCACIGLIASTKAHQRSTEWQLLVLTTVVLISEPNLSARESDRARRHPASTTGTMANFFC